MPLGFLKLKNSWNVNLKSENWLFIQKTGCLTEKWHKDEKDDILTRIEK